MALKKWPLNPDEPVSFAEIMQPLRALVDAVYEVKEKPAARLGFVRHYKGFEQGESGKATTPPPQVQFSRDGLAYHLKRDRDAMTLILMEAISAGIEQGRRIERQETKHNGPTWVTALRDHAASLGHTTDSDILRYLLKKMR